VLSRRVVAVVGVAPVVPVDTLGAVGCSAVGVTLASVGPTTFALAPVDPFQQFRLASLEGGLFGHDGRLAVVQRDEQRGEDAPRRDGEPV
jgi:hypothetical protein